MDQYDPSTNSINQDDVPSESQIANSEELTSYAAVYDKSQQLADIANKTFRELCKSLESEQTKLLDLEERRKNLQEEMHRLKAEIEEEKRVYQTNIVQSVAESLKTLNQDTSNEFEQLNFQPLESCYKEDEHDTEVGLFVTETDIKSGEASIETKHNETEVRNVLE